MGMLHEIITAYVIFGGMFTNDRTLLQIHLANNLVVIGHWLTNNNRCFLSNEYEDDAGYSGELVRKITGVTVTNDMANAISYTLAILSALLTAWKLHNK